MKNSMSVFINITTVALSFIVLVLLFDQGIQPDTWLDTLSRELTTTTE